MIDVQYHYKFKLSTKRDILKNVDHSGTYGKPCIYTIIFDKNLSDLHFINDLFTIINRAKIRISMRIIAELFKWSNKSGWYCIAVLHKEGKARFDSRISHSVYWYLKCTVVGCLKDSSPVFSPFDTSRSHLHSSGARSAGSLVISGIREIIRLIPIEDKSFRNSLLYVIDWSRKGLHCRNILALFSTASINARNETLFCLRRCLHSRAKKFCKKFLQTQIYI